MKLISRHPASSDRLLGSSQPGVAISLHAAMAQSLFTCFRRGSSGEISAHPERLYLDGSCDFARIIESRLIREGKGGTVVLRIVLERELIAVNRTGHFKVFIVLVLA